MKQANENQNKFGGVISNTLKTKNSNEMKTKNNIQQTILKSLAVVVSLVIISFTVTAQDYWKSLLKSFDFNEMELAMVDDISIDNREETNAYYFESLLIKETEEALELERWMIDESNFITLFSIDEESESPLNIEDWMTDEAFFTANSFYIEVETEETLNLENWMTDANYFEPSPIQIMEEADAKLDLEDWMLDEELFTANVKF